MEQIIVTTKNELHQLIQTSVREAFNEQTNNNETFSDKMLSISEACEFLNLAKQTLYGFTSKNEIPFIKRGKKLYFRKSDLEAWLMQGKQLTKDEIIEQGFNGLTNRINQKNGK